MRTDQQTRWTALYERLSRDDDTFGDSVSIAHQKAYLRKYADEHGFTNCHDYTDDGYSGGTFDRPAWNQMIADIEADKVGTVTTEEMKREEALKKRRIYQRRKRKEKRLAKEADKQMT